MRAIRFVLIAALALSNLAGCTSLGEYFKGNGDKKIRPSTKPPEITSEQLVSYLNGNAARFQSLICYDVEMKCYANRFPVPSLKGSIAAAQDRKFRMKFEKMGADVDMGSNPEEFWAYVKTPGDKPTYVFASHTDFDSGRAAMPDGIPFEPDWVMQALGMITYPLNQPYKVTINERERTYTLAWPTKTPSGLAIRKQVVFDVDPAAGNHPQVKKHLILNEKNKVLAFAEIKTVQTVSAGNDPNSGKPMMIQSPTFVILKWEEQQFEMDLTLKNAVVNQPQSPEQARELYRRPDIVNTSPINLADYRPRGH